VLEERCGKAVEIFPKSSVVHGVIEKCE